MKSVAFFRVSAKEVSFCSTKENLNHPFFKPLRKEVHATPSFRSGIRMASCGTSSRILSTILVGLA